MLDISHRQVKYLLRKSLDYQSAMPPEQWTVVQQHLEHCPACREYHDQLFVLERDIHRALHARWPAGEGPAGLADRVLASIQQRRRRRRLVWRGVTAGLGSVAGIILVAVLLLSAWQPQGPSSQELLSIPVTSARSFQDMVAFSARQTGNSEIYLYHPSAEPDRVEMINLTQNPADDTDPAWSPDGEWLAFLSNRTGKREVYVTNIAGTQVRQLTNDSKIDWSGPLSWSPGGAWITLIGHCLDGGFTAAVFYVDVNNGGQAIIPDTEDVTGVARFTSDPGRPTVLLYATKRSGGIVFRYDIHDGSYLELTEEDNQLNGFRTGIDGVFAYRSGPVVDQLLYLAQSKQPTPAGSMQIRQVSSSRLIEGNANDVFSASQASHLRGLSLIPGSDRVAILEDGQHSGCWQLEISQVIPGENNGRIVDGLCVDGGLDTSQWTNDGRWVVLVAHTPGAAATALYSVGIRATAGGGDAITVKKLLGGIDITGPVSVRPGG